LDGIKRGVKSIEQDFLQGFDEGAREANLQNKALTELRASNFKKGKSQAALDEVRYNNELNKRLTQADVSTDNALDVIKEFDEGFEWSEPPEQLDEDQKYDLQATRELAKTQIIGRQETNIFQKVEQERIGLAEEAASSVLGEHGFDGVDKAIELLEENGFSKAEADSFVGVQLEEQRSARAQEFRKEIDASADKFQEDLDLQAFAQLKEAIANNPDLTDSERRVAQITVKEQENRALRSYSGLISNFQRRVSAGIANEVDRKRLETFEDTLPPAQFSALIEAYDNQPIKPDPKDTAYTSDNVYKAFSADIAKAVRDGDVMDGEAERQLLDEIVGSTLPANGKSALIRDLQQLRHTNIIAAISSGEVEDLPDRFSNFNIEDYKLAKDDFIALTTSFQSIGDAGELEALDIKIDQEHLLFVASVVNKYDPSSPNYKIAKETYDNYRDSVKLKWGARAFRSNLNLKR
jgi:hypothetical protein